MLREAFNSEKSRAFQGRFRSAGAAFDWPKFDSFGELCRKPRPLVCVDDEGYGSARSIFVSGSSEAVSGIAWTNDLTAAIALLKGQRDVWLSLPRSLWFDQTVDIPCVGRAEAEQIITLEVARVTPFRADDVITGWYFTETAGEFLKARSVTVRRDIVAPVGKALADQGHHPVGILLRETDDLHIPIVLPWNGKSQWAVTFELYRRTLFATAGLSMLLCWLVYFMVSTAIERQLAAIEAEKTSLVAAVDDVKAKLESVKLRAEGLNLLMARRTGQPLPSAIIAELTRLLPDDTSLTALSLQQGLVDLEGVSDEPEGLVAALEASPLFVDVGFSAPVTSGVPGSGTRFSLRAKIETVKGGS